MTPREDRRLPYVDLDAACANGGNHGPSQRYGGTP
jgi:hypothetical protein